MMQCTGLTQVLLTCNIVGVATIVRGRHCSLKSEPKGKYWRMSKLVQAVAYLPRSIRLLTNSKIRFKPK